MHEAGHALMLKHPHQGRLEYNVISIMNQGNVESKNVAAIPIQYDQYNLRKVWGG